MVREISHPYLESLYTQIINKNFKIYEYKNRLDILKGIQKVDIVHLHWIESLFIGYNQKYIILITTLISLAYINLLFFIKYIARIKVVITLHNLRPHKRIYPLLEHEMFKFSLKLADAVIVHNNYSKKSACRLYDIDEKKVWVIPHGTFGSCYPNFISKKEARTILEIPENKYVILFFGSISQYKGIEELLKVMEDISIHEKGLFIIIAGRCAEDNLKRKIEDFSNKFKQNSLVRLERIPDEDIQIYMNASDVGILPYSEIATSGVLLLFMSFKKPIIVSDLEPFRELLQDAGIYYKHGSDKDLQNILLKTKRGGYNLEELSQKVFEISQKYQWEDIAEKTIEVYNNLISEQSKIAENTKGDKKG